MPSFAQRRSNVELAEVGRDVAVLDLLPVLSKSRSGGGQEICLRRGHAALREDVVRHARAAADANRRASGAYRRLQRLIDGRIVQIILIGIVERGIRVLRVHVIKKHITEGSLAAGDETIIGVLKVGEAPAAFNIASSDVNISAGGTGHSRVGRDHRRSAQNAALLGTQKRIAAVHQIAIVGGYRIARLEQSRRRDHYIGLVVHEAKFKIRLDMLVQIQVRKKSGVIALILTLDVFVGA